MPQPRSRPMPIAAITAAAFSMMIWTTSARADGGLLRHWERQGAYEIAIFTMPTPLTVGQVDISVLVLDRSSGAPVTEATVEVELALVSDRNRATRHAATTAAATNKLFRSALVEFPSPGAWVVAVTIEAPQGNTKVDFRIDVSNPSPGWFRDWPWVCWPIGVVLVYAIHQWLVHRKADLRASGLELRSHRADTRESPSVP